MIYCLNDKITRAADMRAGVTLRLFTDLTSRFGVSISTFLRVFVALSLLSEDCEFGIDKEASGARGGGLSDKLNGIGGPSSSIPTWPKKERGERGGEIRFSFSGVIP